MSSNYKPIDRLQELRDELWRRSLQLPTTTSPETQSVNSVDEEDEDDQAEEIQSSPFYDRLHASVQDLAESGLQISAHRETVTFLDDDGNILRSAVVPEPDYNDPNRKDSFSAFLDDATTQYLENAFRSLGWVPIITDDPRTTICGTYNTRLVRGRLTLLGWQRIFELTLEIGDGTFRLYRRRERTTWPAVAEVATAVAQIEADLVNLCKLAAFLTTQAVEWAPEEDRIRFLGCTVRFELGKWLISFPHDSEEAEWQNSIKVIHIVRQFLLEARTPPVIAISPPSMQADIELG